MSSEDEPRTKIVVLDRIEPGEPQPDYCTYGRASCVRCNEWCWLGDKTAEAVAVGGAAPLCLVCATQHIDSPDYRIGHLSDTRHGDVGDDTISKLYARLPEDEWIDLPAFGAKVRRWRDTPWTP